ncbi:citryl-CoA lyase [Vreelandella malpeensis]|uniref:citrate synthase (unknown stereospecificity) n=1 Tax=Vreelandella malpeensis TaxID=1172368 RepID=A0ABS8DNP4_9GAMM|nr:citryl-CoA lyase [Halomonas malpeensis]MCB8887926.1 citryl-CoA lyase [Halomonas malpeensis]
MTEETPRTAGEDWWSTEIIEMRPGMIRYRGYAIEELIGRIGFPDMIWLMLRGDLPSAAQATLLSTVLMSAVDHGPQAPSIAIARIASTCGVGINSAMASATNALGDVHGGAGEQCVTLYLAIAARHKAGESLSDATRAELDALRASGVRYVPGFGHRFHPRDPRAPRLMEVLRATTDASIDKGFADIAEEVERQISKGRSRPIPMNVDGATGAIYAALGFAPALCRGLFVLSRSVGVMSHAWEQMQRPERNKGPLPRSETWTYTGHPPRSVEPEGKRP